jgi:hypothetical protein
LVWTCILMSRASWRPRAAVRTRLRSLNVATRVRIPLGVPQERPSQRPRVQTRGLLRFRPSHPTPAQTYPAAHVRQCASAPARRVGAASLPGPGPLTGKKRYGSGVVRTTGKQTPGRSATGGPSNWPTVMRCQRREPSATLAAQWIAVKERRWPPNTLQEHRRIVARNLRPLHDVDVAKITTHTLDVLYAELAARGGACTHRPCSPAPCWSTARGANASSASALRARTRAPARTGRHVTTSRVGTAHRCRPPAFLGSIPWCALRSVRL